jgi:hypothetical protein
MMHTGGASQKKAKKGKERYKKADMPRHAHRVRRVTHRAPPWPHLIVQCSVIIVIINYNYYAN